MTDEQIVEWNAVIASGDEEAILAMQNELIRETQAKIMDEDANYAMAGWTAT